MNENYDDCDPREEPYREGYRDGIRRGLEMATEILMNEKFKMNEVKDESLPDKQ